MQTDEIVKRLRELSEQMIQLGADMERCGINKRIEKKGSELRGAGLISSEWADEIAKLGKPATN
jgi:hypothetical protein